MTTLSPDPTNTRVDGPPATPRTLQVLGGLSLLTAPLLFAGGAATSPPQADGSTAAYVTSLAADPTLTAVSANLFHYSWVLFAAGALAAIGLVRGRRGWALTLAGGLAAAFGSVQFTGLLYSDWVLAALGGQLPITEAVAIADVVSGSASIAVWLLSAKVLGLLGFPVLYAGLARAGVIGWWLVPVSLLPVFAFALVPGLGGVLLGALCFAPAYVVGARLVRRARLA